jgi:Protein of unknown function (DUF3467)
MNDANKSQKPASVPPELPVAKVHWDQSQMRIEYANVINVISTREEFSVLFGMNSTWSLDEPKGFEVKLSNRIVLTPFGAKRLSKLLLERIADYEKKHGALDIGPEGA